MSSDKSPDENESDDARGRQRYPRSKASVTIREPSEAAAAAGVVAHFAWHQAATDTRGTGDLTRGPVGFIVTRLEITAPAPSGITRAALREAPIGDAIEMVRSAAASEVSPDLPVPAQLVEIPPTSKRTLMTDDMLRTVALVFLYETAPGKPRGATQRMVERFGRPQGTIQTWIKRARKEGWLAPGPSGRMAGEPGPRMKAWIAERVSEPVRPGGPSAADMFGAVVERLGGHADERLFRGMLASGNWPEQRAAEYLSVPAVYVGALSVATWGHSLSEELVLRQRPGDDPEDVVRSLVLEVEDVLRRSGASAREEGADEES